MVSTVTVRLQESNISEIETLIHELGLWKTKSDFIREAIEIQIKKYWSGVRLDY